MKATEMRTIAKDAVKPEIRDLNSKILEAAKKGLTTLNEVNVSQGALAFLKDEGFEIESYTIMPGYVCIIKW